MQVQARPWSAEGILWSTENMRLKVMAPEGIPSWLMKTTLHHDILIVARYGREKSCEPRMYVLPITSILHLVS